MQLRFLSLTNSIIALTMSVTSANVQAELFSWPQQQIMAVNLSYDDALDSQLDNALPTLDKYNIKGSFYLTLSNSTVKERIEEWRSLAKSGHELGNHTVFHPCKKSTSGRDWVPNHRNLDVIPNHQMVEEVLVANAMLFAIDGKERRTFTPPCGDVNTEQGNYTKELQSHFVAIKWQNKYGKQFDKVYMPFNVTGDELIAYVKNSSRQGGALSIIFHGIGGDHLSVSTEAHAQLVGYLAENKSTYWTDTYLNIMTHVNARNRPTKQ